MEFLESIMASFPILQYVLMGLGTLVVLAQTFAALKPKSKFSSKFYALSKKSVFEKLFDFLESFAPIKKDQKGGFKLNNRHEDD